jgi:hypothetical protein
MATGVREKYHVAINSKGYMLRGAPNKPAYSRRILPSQVSRMAISDLAYSDFAGQGLFYLAQTDWSAGFKDEKTWRDDAKFYYSTNIDAYSQRGAIKLEKELTQNVEISEDILCGCNGTVGGNVTEFIGTGDNAGGYPQIYYYWSNAWTAIAATTFGTGQNAISQMICHKNLLFAFTVGAGNTWVVGSWDWSTWTDHSAAILTASSLDAMGACRCACEYNSVLYAFCDNALNDKISLMSTADAGTTWVEEYYNASCSALPVAICGFNSKIYYLLDYTSMTELRCFDPATNADVSVRMFPGAGGPTFGSHKLLTVFQNKLIITLPNTKIYSLDTAGDLTEIWLQDSTKNSISSYLATGYIYYGALECDNRLYWGNLIYDGTNWFSHKRPSGDPTDSYLVPNHINQSGYIRYINTADKKHLWQDATTYKTTIANNYLITNEMAPVQAIDKILDSVTILFEKMATGDSIQVYYSIDERATWVDLGTRSYSASDSSTKKVFTIPGNVIFNKIWFKIHLDGSATSAALTDLVLAYRPMPEFKLRWDMRLNFSNGVKLLNGQNEEREGYELLSELWKEKLVKQRVILEDMDYVEVTLTANMGSTATSAAISVSKSSHLPRQGRIRAVSGTVAEEMYYTSAYQNAIKGITRGARGTVARAYSTGQTLDNGYHVYIENIESEINFIDENKAESIAQVTLIEA